MRFIILLLWLAETAWALPATDEPPWEAQPRLAADSQKPDPEWWEQHQSLLRKAREGNVEVLLLGDSITEAWDSAPDVWNAHFAGYTVANFGISGDTTQNLLWRITIGGELAGLSPRLVVLLIGTNNLDQRNDSSADTARGVEAIVQTLRTSLPDAKILLLGIFPRGATRNAVFRQRIRDVNQAIARLANRSAIRYLDIGPRLLDPDGNLLADALPDGIHPSVKGYAIWADAMQPELEAFIRRRMNDVALKAR